MRLSLCFVVALIWLSFHAFALERNGNVTVDDFEGVMTTSLKNFLGLAEKWENESLGVVFHDGMTNLQLGTAHGTADTLDKCAAELRKAIKEEQAKNAKTDAEADLFWDAKQGRNFEPFEVNQQDFTQQIPQPSISPYTPRPEGTNGSPILIPTKRPLQTPTRIIYSPIQTVSCGTQVYMTTYQVRRGWRPFQPLRNRRATRQMARGGGC